jgi:hypothetical protein
VVSSLVEPGGRLGPVESSEPGGLGSVLVVSSLVEPDGRLGPVLLPDDGGFGGWLGPVESPGG